MLIKLKNGIDKSKIFELLNWIEAQGISPDYSDDEENIIGVLGNIQNLDIEFIRSLDFVEDIVKIESVYGKTSREYKSEDTIITLANGTKIGGGNFMLAAGPCSVECEEQIVEVAKRVKASGANILRGGAFKPRTSPYSFQGIGVDGLELLKIAKKETGLPIVTEIMDINQIKNYEDVDILQVGARNMQNFGLLKELGKLDKPILLKRGLSATYEEFLLSAEYILKEGNKNVILCERGIRTFEKETRNTLDISVVPVLREKTHLPIIVDPSHAIGISRFVKSLAFAAVGAGADGLIIEVHNDPKNALSDGAQSLTPEEFDETAKGVFKLRETVLSL